ncbi:D-sedoheptulose 7-phosphate isomerase (EC 5.3.1.28) [uncultured Gammaproteobacteria bacterium]|jgi:D-sedoheptulose 7-phosphate isomerase|nr:D-sedoheptulose 7-phosphate isomerase (EC 5.3.1.28) [uncultured Gammaproteobacteria bacterium]CAC9587551.1 D-sedoheptulose 7-phosphate isomerase (EC 5.3.1.28) [uncultured Gammaproteobacteria bacterium]CAC9966434.1 D-sedoheptulose 7-phosphate isomerase (EC 5.3.1.28) [uncultured Gammaproteobacteria bacterium]
MQSVIESEFNAHLKTTQATMSAISTQLEMAVNLCTNSLNNGGKILIFGNGGSAADAQHIAAELVGRYKIERQGLAAIALTTDTSALTSIGNDYGYEFIFSRQIEALANKNDVIIGISTGGSSVNVINGLQVAKDLDCQLIGLSGRSGGEMNALCDVNLVVPDKDTPRIQEMHILIGHTLCHLIEQNLSQ